MMLVYQHLLTGVWCNVPQISRPLHNRPGHNLARLLRRFRLSWIDSTTMSRGSWLSCLGISRRSTPQAWMRPRELPRSTHDASSHCRALLGACESYARLVRLGLLLSQLRHWLLNQSLRLHLIKCAQQQHAVKALKQNVTQRQAMHV